MIPRSRGSAGYPADPPEELEEAEGLGKRAKEMKFNGLYLFQIPESMGTHRLPKPRHGEMRLVVLTTERDE